MSRVGRDRSEESIKGLKEFDSKLMMKKHWFQILEGKYLLSADLLRAAALRFRVLNPCHGSRRKPLREDDCKPWHGYLSGLNPCHGLASWHGSKALYGIFSQRTLSYL